MVAVKLKVAFAEELCIDECLDPDSPTYDYIEHLAESAGLKRIPKIVNRSLADAWIHFLQLKIRQMSLEQLKIESGDIVKTYSSPAEVSSIGNDGRVYF